MCCISDSQRPCSTCVRSHAYALAHSVDGGPLGDEPECTYADDGTEGCAAVRGSSEQGNSETTFVVVPDITDGTTSESEGSRREETAEETTDQERLDVLRHCAGYIEDWRGVRMRYREKGQVTNRRRAAKGRSIVAVCRTTLTGAK